MKIDRMFFNKFEDKVKDDPLIKAHVEQGKWDQVIDYVNEEIMDKPEEYFTLDKLRHAAGVDRRLSMREIIEKVLGLIPSFKSKDDLLEEEFAKFIADYKPEEPEAIMPMKYYFKAYATDANLREIIESKRYTDLHTHPSFTMRNFRSVPKEWRARIPEYIKDYVPLNQFMA